MLSEEQSRLVKSVAEGLVAQVSSGSKRPAQSSGGSKAKNQKKEAKVSDTLSLFG